MKKYELIPALGIGGALTKGAETGDFAAVTRTARQLKEAVGSARGIRLI